MGGVRYGHSTECRDSLHACPTASLDSTPTACSALVIHRDRAVGPPHSTFSLNRWEDEGQRQGPGRVLQWGTPQAVGGSGEVYEDI